MYYNSISELIGNTPLIKLNRIKEKFDLKANVFAKVEKFNPAGSSKDRVALNMIEDAEKRGIIKAGATIIEPTSGNTGIGLALVSLLRGYKMILVMPDTMSKERIGIVKAYGAEVILTDGKMGMAGSIEKAEELHDKIENSFILSQFSNYSNSEAHYKTTGPEIFRDLDGKVDIFIATIGTGGTISGTAKFLKEKNPDAKIIGIEPEESPLITKGKSGAHGIQGIGANFIPEILDLKLIDDVLTVSTDDAFSYASLLSKTEGIQCGISSGAALFQAIKLAILEENSGKNIVTLLPDGGDRYYSTKLFEF